MNFTIESVTFRVLVLLLALPLFIAQVGSMPFDVSQLDRRRPRPVEYNSILTLLLAEEFENGPQLARLLNKAD